jgi:antitoxin ParD1/3/4
MGSNVVIREEFAEFIERKVASGEYSSAQEVIEKALRTLELAEQKDEEKLAWLRDAWDKGIASGNIGPLDAEELKRELQRRRAARA